MMHGESAAEARILVVEPEPNARAAVVALLRDAGYAADGAADEAQAQASIAAARPDLVLADVTASGLERMARLRETDAALVAMTAFGSVDAAVAAVERGADDYLSKPVERRELLQVTRRTLACRALERETVRLRRALEGRVAAREPAPSDAAPAIPGSSLRTIERFAILRTLAQVGGCDRQAAEILGISQRELRQRIAAAE